MYLTRLRYFVAAAEEGSIARAASRLHVAQPALTRQLRALEREVGTPLLERHARGVRLLPAGATYLEHARRILVDARNGMEAARRSADAGPPPILISPPDWAHRAIWAGEAIRRFVRLRPEVPVEYRVTPWLRHPDAVREGTIDVGFGVATSVADFGDGIAATRLCDEPASSAILPLSHPLARRRSLRLSDLRDIPTLIPPRASAPLLHDQMVAMVRCGGYEPRVGVASESFSVTMHQVVAGAGWVLSVNSVAEIPPAGTAVIPIVDAPIMLGFYLLRRNGRERDAILDFEQCVRATVGAQSRAGARL
ncbi:MAG: LysR family transcriptional regulator [Gemmatimonadaceae bacterium]|nr:LysR family transcriptional regulator [Gemmatimonadaceae bacterium]